MHAFHNLSESESLGYATFPIYCMVAIPGGSIKGRKSKSTLLILLCLLLKLFQKPIPCTTIVKEDKIFRQQTIGYKLK